MRTKSTRTRRISHILLAFLIGSVLLLAISPLIGVRLDVVLSGSMSPSLNTGDLVVVTQVEPTDLRVGDVIVFHSPLGNGLICHRIIAVEQDGQLSFLTKGDNNEDPDPFVVPSSSVVGKVQQGIPWLGYVVQYLRGPFGLLLILTLALATFLLPEKKAIAKPGEKGNGNA